MCNEIKENAVAWNSHSALCKTLEKIKVDRIKLICEAFQNSLEENDWMKVSDGSKKNKKKQKQTGRSQRELFGLARGSRAELTAHYNLVMFLLPRLTRLKS